MWEFYLSYCEGVFKSKNINLIQSLCLINILHEKFIGLILLILTTGCANQMKPTDFKDQKPRLVIENYLSGNVKAWECYKYLEKLLDNLADLMENGMPSINFRRSF